MTGKIVPVDRPTQAIAISDNTRRFIRKSKAANTVRAYGAAWREFEHYCQGRKADPLPAEPGTVANYLTALGVQGQKVATIEVKLAALASVHRAAGQADPTVSEVVKSTMAGIRRDLGQPPSKKEPATLAEIQAMIATLDTDKLKGQRDKALLLVGFAGAFRRSELVALDVADVRFGDGLRITIKRSKTDQEGKGLLKTIPFIGGELCPVQALREWLDTASIASGPIFRRVSRWGGVGDKRLSSQSVALVIKAAARAAGLDWRSFSGHSLRSGFITASLNGGASDSDIVEQTGQGIATMRGYRRNSGVGSRRAVLVAFGEGG